MKIHSRRTFISLVGTGVFGATGLVSTVSASSRSLVQGQIVDYQGDPIAQRQVTLSIREGGHEEVISDENGRFEAELPPNEICDIGFYKYKYGPKKSEPNGVPHVYVIGEYSTESGETDLGTLSIEEGNLVQAQALDSDGNPVGNAGADLTVKGQSGHYLGTGGNLRTNHDGYVVIDDGPYTGMELTGTVELSISIPNSNGGAIEYSSEFFVDEPLSLTAQIGEGMSINPLDKQASDSDDQSADTEQEPSDEPSENTSDTSTSPQNTTNENTEAQNEGTEDLSGASKGGQNETTTNSSAKTRGFFSNDANDNKFEILSDPFALTVGGFVLSAGGIAHQLIRGR